MYFKPSFIRIRQSILDVQAIVIPNISRLSGIRSMDVQRFFRSNNLPTIASKQYIGFLPVAKRSDEGLKMVERNLQHLSFLIKNKKVRSILKDIMEDLEFMPLRELIDIYDKHWINVVDVLKKSFLNGFHAWGLLNNGRIMSNLIDPKLGISFDVSLFLKFLRLPPDFPIVMVCRPKAIGEKSGERVTLSKAGKALVLEKFEEFKSKLKKISFYVGGTKIDLSKAEEFEDVIHLKEDSIEIPSNEKVPTFLEIHRAIIDELVYSATIKRLYHYGEEQKEHPYRDLQNLLPYDLSFKKFRKIRMIFAISSNENEKVKDLFQKFYNAIEESPKDMLRFLGGSEKLGDVLNLKIVDDIIEFNSVDDLINDLKQTARPLSVALSQEEADIIIIGTSAYRGAPRKSGAKEKYDAVRKKLLENGYANQFISYYSASGNPAGLLAQFERGGSSYEFSLGNFMLNVYCKVSGRPWAVRQDPSSAAHAIIALGFAKSDDNKFGIGVSVVIDEYGDLIQISSWDLPDSVLRSKNLFVDKGKMKDIILRVADNIAHNKKYLSRISLTVYKYGRFSEDELQGMRDAVDELSSSELRISPISVQKESIYPYSSKKYVRLTNRSVLFSPLKNAYASVAILWPLGSDYDYFSDLGGMVNNIEALLRLHWQTLWTRIRRLAILKAANRIARDRLNGYSLPSDPALIKTPWFI